MPECYEGGVTVFRTPGAHSSQYQASGTAGSQCGAQCGMTDRCGGFLRLWNAPASRAEGLDGPNALEGTCPFTSFVRCSTRCMYFSRCERRGDQRARVLGTAFRVPAAPFAGVRGSPV